MRSAAIAIVLALCAAGAVSAETTTTVSETPTAPEPAPHKERHFRFARLEMAAEAYSDSFKDLFDAQPSFDKLEDRLKDRKIDYVLSALCMTAADFPERVRPRLDTFQPGDNLLDRGEELAVILKIAGIYGSKAECLGALDRLGTRPELKA